MKRALLRYVLPSLALLLLIAVLGGIKAKQIGSLISMGKAMEKAGPPPEPVGSAQVVEQAWEGTLSSVGTVATARGVSVSSEVAGTVTSLRFDSGATVRQGQILVELESQVERAQLASLEARKALYVSNFTRSKALLEGNAISKSQYDADEAQLKTTLTDIEAMKAQIERKTIRAPFAGRLGIRAVNLGQYLNAGTVITELETIRSMFVDFTLPQEALSTLKVGMPVRVSLSANPNTDDEALEVMAKIAAIDPTIDSASRAIKLRASLPNDDEKLRAGMFAKVKVVLPSKGTVRIVPVTAVVRAPYGDSVFVIEARKADAPGTDKDTLGRPVKMARQQFVRVGETRGDFVVILDGVEPGQEVVTSGIFKLRNGSPIVIDNSAEPKSQLDPKPENR